MATGAAKAFDAEDGGKGILPRMNIPVPMPTGPLQQTEGVVTASDRAVSDLRQYAVDNPDAFLPDLASSLSNLANGLAALGRYEEALAALSEAVAINRRLGTLSRLASSLNHLGNILSVLGRPEDAVAAGDEAVQIFKKLGS